MNKTTSELLFPMQ